MDPSTRPVQSTSDAQPMTGRAQPPTAVSQPGNMSQAATNSVVQPTAAPQTISVHPEQGPVQTGGTQTEDHEDGVVQPAKQEVATGSTQPDAEVQEVEIKPSIPEVAVEKSVENIVEKAPTLDKPKLSEEVKAVGVTHSGPGIPVEQNTLGIKNMPMTFDQAVVEEKKHPKLNDSKHWLAELVQYVWRKIDPLYGKSKGVK